uniref:VPS9 domain-containing protein n=1 Tax=Wuchereria bancrofti TaxID=6293 RepID=A0AAF5RVD9_WUCBA
MSGYSRPSVKCSRGGEGSLLRGARCVSQFAPAGDSHVWTTDDLLPAFVYVTVRAQLQHLGAEIRLIEDFTPQLQGSRKKIEEGYVRIEGIVVKWPVVSADSSEALRQSHLL